MQNIEVEKQIESFEKRVEFLVDRSKLLMARVDELRQMTGVSTDDFLIANEISERQNEIYKLGIELESKEALIAMRKKDLERVAQEKEKEVNEVKANYAMLINKIKEAVHEIKEPQAKALIQGIITRSSNPELPVEEMVKDYKIMKSIMAIIPKEKPVETTELKVSEK